MDILFRTSRNKNVERPNSFSGRGFEACPISQKAVQNPLIANMAKLHFASKYHQFIELIQDIGGGIIGTAPDRKDWEHPDLHDYLEH